jgi:hypothetical protein
MPLSFNTVNRQSMSHDDFNGMLLFSTKLDLLAAQTILLQQDEEQRQMKN